MLYTYLFFFFFYIITVFIFYKHLNTILNYLSFIIYSIHYTLHYYFDVDCFSKILLYLIIYFTYKLQDTYKYIIYINQIYQYLRCRYTNTHYIRFRANYSFFMRHGQNNMLKLKKKKLFV